MTDKPSNLGERLSSLEATVSGMDKYAHEKWHDLSNTLQPLAMLPERITRDIAKLQGSFDSRIVTVTKDVERTITAAVKNALMPVIADVAELKCKVEKLEIAHEQQTGAKNLATWIMQSPLVGWIAAALIVFAAWWRGEIK